MPKISAPTLEAHRAATIDRLLDAFGELVLERGYADVSLADLAAQAGLARTAIYNYFPDRESLLFAWTEREVRRTIALLQRDVAAEETCAGKLRVFVRQHLVDFSTRHLPPAQQVMQFLNPETYERFMRHVEPLERIAHDIVAEGVASDEFGDVDPGDTVPMIMACIGAERVAMATKQHDVDQATERVTSFLLRALGAPLKARAAKRRGR